MGSPHRLAWYWLQILDKWTAEEVILWLISCFYAGMFIMLVLQHCNKTRQLTFFTLHLRFPPESGES